MFISYGNMSKGASAAAVKLTQMGNFLFVSAMDPHQRKPSGSETRESQTIIEGPHLCGTKIYGAYWFHTLFYIGRVDLE